MNQTPNYKLSQWEATDKVQRTDFNADNAKIDAALKAQADSHAALAARSGNCQIYVTSYVGDGTFNSDHYRTFAFPKKPLLVFLIHYGGVPFTLMTPGQSSARPFGANTLAMPIAPQWQGNTLSWRDAYDAQYSYNLENNTYYVVALLAADQ